MFSIREISFSEASVFSQYCKKHKITLTPHFNYLGGYVGDELVCISAYKFRGCVVLFSCSFTKESHRNNGYYNKMFDKRIELSKGKYKVVAYCTKYSVKTFVRNGFSVVKSYKIGTHLMEKVL